MKIDPKMCEKAIEKIIHVVYKELTGIIKKLPDTDDDEAVFFDSCMFVVEIILTYVVLNITMKLWSCNKKLEPQKLADLLINNCRDRIKKQLNNYIHLTVH